MLPRTVFLRCIEEPGENARSLCDCDVFFPLPLNSHADGEGPSPLHAPVLTPVRWPWGRGLQAPRAVFVIDGGEEVSSTLEENKL